MYNIAESKVTAPSKNIEKVKCASNEYQVPEHLLCKMCTDAYKEPRILPCLHSFCNDCLLKEIEKVGYSEKAEVQKCITCPICKKAIAVTSVSDLPQNLYLGFEVEVVGMARHLKDSRKDTKKACDSCHKEEVKGFCLECEEMLCKACWDYHKRNRNLSKHKVASLDETTSIEDMLKLLRKEYNCSESGHEKQMLDFYCEACIKPVCNYCVVSQHKEHKFYDISKAASEQRSELKSLQQSLDCVMQKLNSASNATDKIRQQVEASKHSATTLIKTTCEDLYHALKEREAELLKMVEAIAGKKIEALKIQINGFNMLQKEVQHNNQLTTKVLETNNDQQLVALRKVLQESMKNISDRFEKVNLLPNQHSSIMVHLDKDDLSDNLTTFGTIDDCCLSKSTWTWSSPNVVIVKPHVNSKYQLLVEMKNDQGENLKIGGLPLIVELTSASQDQNVNVIVEDNKDGSYTVSFTSAFVGNYKLHISVQGHYIHNTPLDITFVKRNYLAATTMQSLPIASGCNQNGQWQSIAVQSNGSIVAGAYNNSYSHIHFHEQKNGKCIRSIGGANSNQNGFFNNPRGITINGDELYVVEANNNRVQKFKAESYEHQSTLWPGQFSQPYSLCINTQGNIYVADFGNSKIHVFDVNAKQINTIAGNGSGNAAFVNPSGIAFDYSGNLHIAAYKTTSIKVFSSDGKYIRMYGDGLQQPTAIAIDSCGHSLICDNGKNQLLIFDPEGNLVNSISGLNNPTSVAIDQVSGTVYVANFGNNQILQC